MLEPLFQILCEFLLQTIGETLVELGFHAIAEPFRKTPNPWLAAVGYALMGMLAGGLSLLVFHAHFVLLGWHRIANLILTPLAVGSVMLLIGSWRANRGLSVLRIERFAYGYLFALGFALIRYWFAR